MWYFSCKFNANKLLERGFRFRMCCREMQRVQLPSRKVQEILERMQRNPHPLNSSFHGPTFWRQSMMNIWSPRAGIFPRYRKWNSQQWLAVLRKICRLSSTSRTRKPETNARAIMCRNRKAIYYAPFDHHLNANSLITPGANCYVLSRLFTLAYEQISEAFPKLATVAFTAVFYNRAKRYQRREKDWIQ